MYAGYGGYADYANYAVFADYVVYTASLSMALFWALSVVELELKLGLSLAITTTCNIKEHLFPLYLYLTFYVTMIIGGFDF